MDLCINHLLSDCLLTGRVFMINSQYILCSSFIAAVVITAAREEVRRSTTKYKKCIQRGSWERMVGLNQM